MYKLLTGFSIGVAILQVLGEIEILFDLYVREKQVDTLALNEQEKPLQQKVLKIIQKRLKKEVG